MKNFITFLVLILLLLISCNCNSQTGTCSQQEEELDLNSINKCLLDKSPNNFIYKRKNSSTVSRFKKIMEDRKVYPTSPTSKALQYDIVSQVAKFRKCREIESDVEADKCNRKLRKTIGQDKIIHPFDSSALGFYKRKGVDQFYYK